jgi:hypothetical protein
MSCVQRNFHEDYDQQEIAPPSERSTGLVFAAMAGLVAAVWHNAPTVWAPATILALAFAVLSLLSPALLKPLNLLWFRITMLLHRIINPVLMLAMYTVAIVPMGLIMQLTRDPLRDKCSTAGTTYWVDKTTQPGRMENQF